MQAAEAAVLRLGADEMWSFVRSKKGQRWRWWVEDAAYFDYYNHKRRHSGIGYLKPYLFHQQLLANITQLSPA